MTEAVVFDDVTFAYPSASAPVLRNAHLQIPEGSYVLVTGATGSGKSTLLRAVNGLVPHFTGGRFSGRVLTHGRDTRDRAPRYLAELAAFVPQDPGAAFVVEQVEDELAYAMENLAVPNSQMRRRVEETLDLLDIEPLRDRSVRTLSGGERQRVAIAAALTLRPRVLLLDEPTSQLDPQGAEDVLAALQRLVHDLGMTVIVAEHRLERVAGFVDLAVGCRLGHPPELGAPDDVLDSLNAGPPVCRLGRMLGWRPAPLTVRDARRHARSSKVPAAFGNTPAPPKRDRPLVETRAVSAAFDDRVVLRDVDVSLAAGEIVALMGRNGAGKTTLLRCLCGLKEPSRGRVRAGSSAPRPGRDVALCPQAPESVLFRDRVLSEVETTVDASRSGMRAASVLVDLGIDELASCHPRDLSAGERLLVAIAAVVATGATVLLLDEPTRGLDPHAKKRLCSLLRRFAGAGRAVMFATHDVELAAEVSTRVVMLAGGEIIADGAPSDVLGDSPVFAPQMARVFGPAWLTPEQVVKAMVTAS